MALFEYHQFSVGTDVVGREHNSTCSKTISSDSVVLFKNQDKVHPLKFNTFSVQQYPFLSGIKIPSYDENPTLKNLRSGKSQKTFFEKLLKTTKKKQIKKTKLSFKCQMEYLYTKYLNRSSDGFFMTRFLIKKHF